MLRRAAFAALLLLAAPSLAAAIDTCPGCVLGLYDDTALTSNFGVSQPGVPKVIYLGIDLAGSETGLSGIEFSVAGLQGLLVIGVETLNPGALTLGSLPAPADTSAASAGTGGMNMAWTTCQPRGALVRISLLHFAPAVNHVLRVLHKFPQSNPLYNRLPVFTRCDSPNFTAVRTQGGCYVLNPDGDPSTLCPVGTVAVNSRTWSGVKQLFR